MHLTEEQKAIVTAGYEHCLITAVAGSGKTTTLAWRIRHLLEQGHDPRRMLILMFNRSARNDFQRKLRDLAPGLPLPEVRTYHAMGYRLYRRFIHEGILPPVSEQVLTEQEIFYQVWQLTRRLAPEELESELRRAKKEFVETGTGFIERVKSTLKPAELVFEALDYRPQYRYLVDLFHQFEQWRKRLGRISYADMLYEPVMAISQNPRLQTLVGNKMDLVLVDEYQDTNEIQHLLLRYVAGDRARVTVVGDPDQTIYEFRGAQPAFILRRFSEEFDRPRELTLSYSFRYGHRIALLANHLIRHNRDRKDVLCHAHPSTPESRIHLLRPADEAEAVVRLAEQMRAEGRPLENLAVLFRVWSQSVAIELRLLARQVPYQINAHKGALFTREVESLIQLLRLAARQWPEDGPASREEALMAAMRFPHVGAPEAQLQPLASQLAQAEQGWGRALKQAELQGFKPLARRNLSQLAEALDSLEGNRERAADLLADYADITRLDEGIRQLALTHETGEERVATVHGFLHYLRTLDVGAAGALTHLTQLRQQATRSGKGGLHLSTLHRTKGLEWPVVIIPGLVEGQIPYTVRATQASPELLESERRLLYVGLTRAREALYLLAPPETARTSRFLAEMQHPVSDSLGTRLHAPDSPETLALDIPVTPTARRYAALEGKTLDAPEPPASSTDARAARPPWETRRVVHAVFGAGEVTHETEAGFDVRFGDGRVLRFSKKSAHLYFRASED